MNSVLETFGYCPGGCESVTSVLKCLDGEFLGITCMYI